MLDELDSVNYALALARFDLAAGQPHPPGYLLFIWAARGAHFCIRNPVAALTAISALSGALSIPLLFGLFTTVMSRRLAAIAAIVTALTCEVWLQHVRPMQDAFAFLWLLLAIYMLIRADRNATAWTMAQAMFTLGLASGAKQILPLLVVGLLLKTIYQRRLAGVRLFILSVPAFAAGSLIWFVPLSIHCGSPRRYLHLAAGQLLWQKRNDAAIFSAVATLVERLQVTFLMGADSMFGVTLVWVFALYGALCLKRERQDGWIVWLLVPLLIIRVTLLGAWPRFNMYYIPFVVGLATVGLGRFLTSMLPSRPAAVAVYAVAVVWWVWNQVSLALPMLQHLRRGPAPVDAALKVTAAQLPASTTLVVTDSDLIRRHIDYYGKLYGFPSPDILHPSADRVSSAQSIVHIYSTARPRISSSWAGAGRLIGTWDFDVPRPHALAPLTDLGRIQAAELFGPYITFRRWISGGDEGRWATPLSTVVILKLPPPPFVVELVGSVSDSVHVGVGVRRDAARWPLDDRVIRLPIGPRDIANGRLRVSFWGECLSTARCLDLQTVRVLSQ